MGIVVHHEPFIPIYPSILISIDLNVLILSAVFSNKASGRPGRRLVRVGIASVVVALGLVALLWPDSETYGGIFQ